MDFLTRAFFGFAVPTVVLGVTLALVGVSLSYAIVNADHGLYITALTLAGFAVIPAVVLIRWLRLNTRVLIRENHLEVRYHSSYKKCPSGLLPFVYGYGFNRVMDALETEMTAYPELGITKGFKHENVLIEFCPFEALQDPRRDSTEKTGGLQYGNKIMVMWKAEDTSFTKSLIAHELGHVLIWLNHPTMSSVKHHEILAKCHL